MGGWGNKKRKEGEREKERKKERERQGERQNPYLDANCDSHFDTVDTRDAYTSKTKKGQTSENGKLR